MVKNAKTGLWEVDDKHPIIKELTWVRDDQ